MSSSTHNNTNTKLTKSPIQQRNAKSLSSLPSSPSATAIHTNNSTSHQNDFDKLVINEFLLHERQTQDEIKEKDIKHFISLPGSTVHPQAEKELQARCNKKLSSNNDTHFSSTTHRNDRQRMSQLGKSLQHQKTHNQQKKKKKKKLTPYDAANSKISRVLRHIKPRGKREDMQATQLNHFYDLVKTETSAAIILQSSCRRVLATEYVKLVALRTRKAIQLQSFVRVCFARRLLQRLKDRFASATIVRERFVRLYVARHLRKKRIKLEQSSAVICQSAIRMFFAKQVVNLMRLQLSWEVNQQRWRSISTRLSWSDLRVNFYARQIQCIVRRKLAQRRVSSLFVVYTKAATRIQSIWRRYVATQHKADIIYQNSIDQHSDKIRLIASEHRYWKQQFEELTKPTKLHVKNDLIEQRQGLEVQRRDKYEEIHTLELHYKDQLQIQQQITPRAIAGGWEEQVQINLKDTRERITKAKLSLFFDIEKKLKSVNEEITRIQSIEDEAKKNAEHWSNWQDVEQERLWSTQRQHEQEIEGKEARKSIIDEKLKWQVKHCVPSGKPDKRRPLCHVSSDDGGSTRDRAQQNFDNLQASAHLTNTFKPIQKMIDQCNNLDINDFQVKENVRGKVNTSHHHLPFTSQMATTNHKERQPTQDFKKKLPWELLNRVRDERMAIHSKFATKEAS